ncbi:hypothetical protein [uncultured Pseudacidovorax sp.]|uniref:hypothetical protein n=1 Tax=uncultured Pseudacidovorax sp. TaxID=679313 RepID=UPI0025F92179|nr:hypothetical protein [uncultured Pseudacidovorax sp.]
MSEIVADAPAGASTGGSALQSANVDPTSVNAADHWNPAPAVDPAALPPNHPDSLSPTKIELFIRPTKGEAFERGFQEACDAAGLTSPGFEGHVTQNKRFLHVYGSRAACCDDTGHALVWFSPNAEYVRMPLKGMLKEIRVTVDPRHCPLPGGYGSLARHFRDGVKGLLEAMGDAVLVDGMGHPISTDDLEKVVHHIHHEVEARSVELERSVTTDLGGGRFRIQGRLSFQYRIETRGMRGAVKGFEWVHFDAPTLRWGAGRAKGAEMAREHLAWLRAHRQDDADLLETLEEAFAAMRERRPGQQSPSRCHAADGYLQLMVEALSGTAKFINPAWVESKVEDARRLQEWDEKTVAENLAPARAARAAKQAQRKGGAA